MDSAVQSSFSLKILGGFELRRRGEVVDLSARKTACLLAYLACTAPVPQPRERLATLLWSAGNDTRARHNLRQAISGLRRSLGQDAIIANNATVVLRPHVLDCDAARLGRLFGKTTNVALAEATALYGGTLLADVYVDEPAWNDWLTVERVRIDELAISAMIAHAEQELVAGRFVDALQVAYRAVAQNRFREDAHRVLLRSLAAAGRNADAIRHYNELRAYLRTELGAVPDAETRQIIEDLANADIKKGARPGLPPPTNVPQDGTRLQGPDDPAPAPEPETPVAARRRLVTVLICELTGAGQDATVPDPEDTEAQIRPFLAQVATVATSFGAHLLPYNSGTAQMIFGYPITHEDDPVQAVRAGIALVQAVASFGPLNRAGLAVRVGIASGRAVIAAGPVGSAGNALLVIGDVQHSAMEVLNLAGSATVAVSPQTRRVLPVTFDLRAIGTDNGQTQAWQVAGLQSDALSRAARRRVAPVRRVGRHEEFDLLCRRLDLARTGTGRVVLISGEAGVGKTRLVEDLLEAPSARGTALLRYVCSRHDINRPLHPFIDSLAGREEMLSARTPAERRDHLEAYVRTNSGDPDRDMALLCDLMMLPADGRFPVLLASDAQKREMLTTALLDWIVRLASKSPLILHFEDIHWIDPSSHDLLSRMIERIADLPVLLVATMRPDDRPVWIGQPHVTMIHLSRLDPRESAELVGVVTGDMLLPGGLVQQIIARADGVPLYIKELTRHAMGREAAPKDIKASPVSLSDRQAVPATLQASLIARLDQSSAFREVALVASAIGRSFSFALIAALVDMPDDGLTETLDLMTAAGLLLQTGTPPFAKYVFTHALMREAAYDMMLKPQRETLHGHIADQLIGPMSASTDCSPSAVAQLLSLAGRTEEAVGYYVTASRMAQKRWANREAAQFLDLAIDAVDTLPESPATLRLAIDLRFEAKNALTPLAEFGRIVVRLLEAREILHRMSDESRLCHFFIHMSQTLGFSGRMGEALQYGVDAAEIAKRLNDEQLLTEAKVFLGTAQYAVADFSGAKKSFLDVLDLVAASPPDMQYLLAGFPDITADALLARISAILGQFDEGQRHGTKAVRRAASLGQPYSQGIAQWCLADLHLARGEIAEAKVLSNAGLALAQQWDLPTLVAGQIGSLGHAHVLGGNIDEGLAMLEQAISDFDRMRHHMGLSLFLVPLAAAHVQAGQTDKARALAARALDLASDNGHHLGVAGARHVLGQAELRDGHPESALRQFADALALSEVQGMRPLVARCHHGLGEVYRCLGDQSKAQNSLGIALAMYRDMGMHYWAKRTEMSS